MIDLLKYNSAKLFIQNEDKIEPVSLVTEFSFSFNVERQEIRSVGYEEVLRPITSAPAVNISFSYMLAECENEKLFNIKFKNEDSVGKKMSMFSNLKALNLFFLSAESGVYDLNEEYIYKINQKENGEYLRDGKISGCFFLNCNLTQYNFSILKGGIKVDVSFVADKVHYQQFKVIDNLGFDFSFEQKNVYHLNNLIVNPDDEKEINEDIGGYKINDFISTFDFSLPLKYKTLYDFGQLYHKRAELFPFQASISLGGFASEAMDGGIENILRQDNGVDFLIYNEIRDCDNPFNIDENSGKLGILIKGALLDAESFSLNSSRGNFYGGQYQFNLDITDNYGIWMAKHVPIGSTIAKEDTGEELFLEFVLEGNKTVSMLAEATLAIYQTMYELSQSLNSNKTNLNCF